MFSSADVLRASEGIVRVQSRKPIFFTILGMCAGAIVVLCASLFVVFPSRDTLTQNTLFAKASSPDSESRSERARSAPDRHDQGVFPFSSDADLSQTAISESSSATAHTRHTDSAHPVTEKPDPPLSHTIEIAQGDTLMGALVGVGIETGEALSAIHSLREVYNPRSLKAGDKITVTFDYDAAEGVSFQDYPSNRSQM